MPSSTKPKERPILFKGPLVRAILEGRKTVTRRVIKDQPIDHGFDRHALNILPRQCPYGVPGETRLWVRETWRPIAKHGEEVIQYRAGGFSEPGPIRCAMSAVDCKRVAENNYDIDTPPAWRPSIFMPRWACRLLLEVTEVRVERLQEITPEEVHAEGIPGMVCGRYQCRDCNGQGHSLSHPTCPTCKGTGDDAIGYWRRGWNDINGKREGCSWESNPWVWRINFKRLEAPNE